jgi:UPF0716 protein FxsA
MPFLIAFLLWLGLELLLAAQLAQFIGVAGVLVWLIVAAILGSWIVQKQGLRTIRDVQDAINRGAPPGDALLRGLLAIGAGILFIVPGVLSDILAVVLLILRTRSSGTRLAERFTRSSAMRRDPVTMDGDYRRTR